MRSDNITWHVDDYGINLNQSKRILRCVDKGKCNSVSIIPNGKKLEACMKILPDNVKKAIHINLVEGFCCGDKQRLNLLVDKCGRFKHGFVGLWMLTLLKPRKMRQQLMVECKAQMDAVMQYLPEDYSIRIDSHMHCHMIPAIMDVICELCVKEEHAIEYIRWSTEPILLYLKNVNTWKNIRIINIIKVIVIKIFSLWDKKYIKKNHLCDRIGCFWGVMFSGEMTIKNVRLLQKDFEKYAYGRDEHLEILFHPGAIKTGEYFLDESEKKFVDFYKADDRKKEAEALCVI